MIVGDGSIRKEVEAAVAASGYADKIMLSGNVEHAIVLHLIRDADILLRTTLFDGDAISVREAFYLGTPVIATDNGMRPEGVHVIPTSDPAALAKQISTLITAGKQKTSSTAADNTNINKIIDLYRDLTTTV
jgi:colanic acid/amylovoran biosynthesis glycosyltransferase